VEKAHVVWDHVVWDHVEKAHARRNRVKTSHAHVKAKYLNAHARRNPVMTNRVKTSHAHVVARSSIAHARRNHVECHHALAKVHAEWDHVAKARARHGVEWECSRC